MPRKQKKKKLDEWLIICSQLVNYGFKVVDIEAMDGWQCLSLYNHIVEDKRKERLLMQLDIAEAINYSYIGSRTKKGSDDYRRWRDKKIKELYPDLPQATIWDGFKKKSVKVM